MKHLKTFHKYGIPVVLLILFSSFFLNSFDWYAYIYDVLISIIFIVFCIREWFEAYKQRKCMWQKASIIGVFFYCFFDIVFVGNYDIIFYDLVQFTTLSIAILSVIYFYIKNEYFYEPNRYNNL